MRICVKRYVHRSRVIEQLIEDWKTQVVHGQSIKLLAELIPESIDVGEFCLKSWEYLHEMLLTEPNADEIENVGNIMKPELPRTLTAFKWIQEMLVEANGAGAMIEDAAAFEAAAKQVREVSAKYETAFPPFDYEAVEESRQAFLRGEGITVEQLIEELTGESQGVAAPTH